MEGVLTGRCSGDEGYDPAIGNVTVTSERSSVAPAPSASLATGTEDVEPKERNQRTPENGDPRLPPRQLLHLERTHVRFGDTKSPTLSGETVTDGRVQPRRREDHITGLATDHLAIHGGDVIDGKLCQLETSGAFEMQADGVPRLGATSPSGT